MFQSRTTTQCGQNQITWDDRVVFLLSLPSEEGKAEKLTEHYRNNAVIICAQGKIKEKEPKFGAQQYYVPEKGISYQIRLPEIKKGMAIYQHKDWWVRPAFVTGWAEVPERTQLFLFQQEQCYFAVLAVCGRECRTDLSGIQEGLQATIASNAGNRNRMEDISLVITAGKNPYFCCENAVREALRFMDKESMFRKNRQYPSVFEALGWCSWDAFYHQVSHQGIMEKMQELKEKEIPLKWVLIDDGWLSADYEDCVLEDLDARESRFPAGLKGCVSELKETYGILQVGVWHAIMGYWNGIKQGSKAQEKLEEGIGRLPDGRLLPAPEAGKAFTFFDKWHEYLKNTCGIDFVKVDGQSAVSLAYGGLETYGKASREIQKGLNASSALHFHNWVINCMGMASEDMWNRPSSAVSRSSDDFVPKEKFGFREHVIQNGYNSLLQGQFFWGDWDMFYSSHEESLQNSILRAVSGGPVYVSDQVGKTDASCILPLIRKDGSIIRCEDIGVPTVDCLLENPLHSGKPLKIVNRYGESYAVAVFSIQEEETEVRGSLMQQDIPGLAGKKWLAYSYRKQSVRMLDERETVELCLSHGEAELFLLVPRQEKVTLIGILEKYISIACVKLLWEKADGLAVLAEEKGTLGFWSGQPPVRVRINGEESVFEEKEQSFYTVWNEQSGSVVELYFNEEIYTGR